MLYLSQLEQKLFHSGQRNFILIIILKRYAKVYKKVLRDQFLCHEPIYLPNI